MSFSLYLAVVALTYIRVFEAFAPELAPYRPMLVLELIALFAALIRVAMTRQLAAAPRHWLILMGLIGSIGLSISTHGWFGGAASALLDFTPTAVLFLLTVLNVSSMPKLRVTCAVIVVSMSLAAAGSVAGYHFGFLGDRLLLFQSGQDENSSAVEEVAADAPASMNSGDVSQDRLVRIRNLGMLSDPNDLAQAIVMVIPFVCLAWRRGHYLRNVFVVVLPASFLLYAIYLTHSRGALVGLSAMLLLSFRKSLGSIRVFTLVGLLIAVSVLTNLAGSRAYSVNEASAGGRIDVWSIGLEMFRAHPWFGVGYGQFIENSAEYGLTAHNSFVLCLAELGLIGCFFWLALIVVTIRELHAADRALHSEDSGEMRRLVIALRASLTGFLVCALFLSRTYAPHLYLVLGLCVGAYYCTVEGENAPRAIGWIPQSGAVLASSILLIYVTIRLKHVFG